MDSDREGSREDVRVFSLWLLPQSPRKSFRYRDVAASRRMPFDALPMMALPFGFSSVSAGAFHAIGIPGGVTRTAAWCKIAIFRVPRTSGRTGRQLPMSATCTAEAACTSCYRPIRSFGVDQQTPSHSLRVDASWRPPFSRLTNIRYQRTPLGFGAGQSQNPTCRPSGVPSSQTYQQTQVCKDVVRWAERLAEYRILLYVDSDSRNLLHLPNHEWFRGSGMEGKRESSASPVRPI